MAKTQQLARTTLNGAIVRVRKTGAAVQFVEAYTGWFSVVDGKALLAGMSAKNAAQAAFWTAAALNVWARVVNRSLIERTKAQVSEGEAKQALRLTNAKAATAFVEVQEQLIALGTLTAFDALTVNELPIKKLV